MSAGRILVGCSEAQTRRALTAELAAKRYDVHDARTGEHARMCLRLNPIDLVLLDLNLPGHALSELCRKIRATSDVAVLVVANCNSEKDRIAILDAGADDYVTKPCSPQELLARIRAILRRLRPSSAEDEKLVELDGLRIDMVTRRVISSGRQMRLTPKEFELLQYLIANSNTTIPHAALMRAVWGQGNGQTAELRVFINQLRKKIEPQPSRPRYLLTEHWVGYRFEMPAKDRI